MDQPVNTSIKSLQIIYSALMLGVFLFLAVSLLLNELNGPFLAGEKEMMQIFMLIGFFIALSSVSAGLIIARKKFENMPKKLSAEQGLAFYQSVMIIRAALFEGAAFFFIVGNLLFAHLAFSIGAFLCLAIMVVYFPTKQRIASEIERNTD